jgi:alkylated DNA repair dioxygenase AlkB
MGIDAPLPLSLFASGAPALDAGVPITRTVLDEHCWVDHAPGWVAGGDALLAQLADELPWSQGRRLMWQRWVDEPRLTCAAHLGDARTPSLLGDLAAALSRRYGLDFHSCFCNFYRDGSDSVAWHADRNGRTEREPYVAIVSLGGPRQFLMRPRDPDVRRGMRSRAWTLHSGDLLVMGGACQHAWEHSVPKMRGAPPRMSVTLRHRPRPDPAATPSG